MPRPNSALSSNSELHQAGPRPSGLVVMLAIAAILPNLVWWAVGLFVVAWIGQFIGHHIEGKKPSFFKDLQFLLIGPAWCMDALYKKVGINS